MTLPPPSSRQTALALRVAATIALLVALGAPAQASLGLPDTDTSRPVAASPDARPVRAEARKAKVWVVSDRGDPSGTVLRKLARGEGVAIVRPPTPGAGWVRVRTDAAIDRPSVEGWALRSLLEGLTQGDAPERGRRAGAPSPRATPASRAAATGGAATSAGDEAVAADLAEAATASSGEGDAEDRVDPPRVDGARAGVTAERAHGTDITTGGAAAVALTISPGGPGSPPETTTANANDSRAAVAPAGPEIRLSWWLWLLGAVALAFWAITRRRSDAASDGGATAAAAMPELRLRRRLSLGRDAELALLQAADRWLVVSRSPQGFQLVAEAEIGDLPDPAAGGEEHADAWLTGLLGRRA